jgi:hypothetical protein
MPGATLLSHSAMIRELETLLKVKVDVASDRGQRERIRESPERGGSALRDDIGHLRDMVEAIEKIEKYVAVGYQAFRQNKRTQVWIIHHLQIIGEGHKPSI